MAVTSTLAERLVILAAAAFLGAVAAVAVVEQRETSAAPAFANVPAHITWNKAFAGSRGPVGDAERTTCGEVLTSKSLGVTHPVLPCGARIVLRNGNTQVLTEVIDNTLVEPGRQLEVTASLAKLLHLEGTQEIEWRFATEASG